MRLSQVQPTPRHGSLEPSNNQVGNLTIGRVGFNIPIEENRVSLRNTGDDTEKRGTSWNVGNNHHGNGSWKHKKLDLPTFDGDNPYGWILGAERYFRFYRLSEEDQLEAVVVALNDDALLWFQYEDDRCPLRSWKEMKAMLVRRFRLNSVGSLHEQWSDHRQRGR